MDEKIYTERKILAGVFLGGPLAGGYYFWRTFNAVGKHKHATVAVVIAILVLVVSVAAAMIPAFDKIPNVTFWAVQVGLSVGAVRGFLSDEIVEHIAASKPVYGWGNTILVALAGLAISIGLVAAFVLVAPSSFDRTTAKYYGTLRHEIVFDAGNISEAEVDRIAEALKTTGFFDSEFQITVDAAKSGNRFIITIYCTDEARDPEAIAFHKALRAELQKSFPSNPIVIDMVVGTPDNRIARLE